MENSEFNRTLASAPSCPHVLPCPTWSPPTRLSVHLRTQPCRGSHPRPSSRPRSSQDLGPATSQSHTVPRPQLPSRCWGAPGASLDLLGRHTRPASHRASWRPALLRTRDPTSGAAVGVCFFFALRPGPQMVPGTQEAPHTHVLKNPPPRKPCRGKGLFKNEKLEFYYSH